MSISASQLLHIFPSLAITGELNDTHIGAYIVSSVYSLTVEKQKYSESDIANGQFPLNMLRERKHMGIFVRKKSEVITSPNIYEFKNEFFNKKTQKWEWVKTLFVETDNIKQGDIFRYYNQTIYYVMHENDLPYFEDSFLSLFQ